MGLNAQMRVAASHLRALASKHETHTAQAWSDGDPKGSPDLPLDLSMRVLDRQLDSLDAIDTKITSVFAGALAVAGLFSGVVALAHKPGALTVGSLIGAGVLAALISVLTILALRSRSWSTGATPEQVATDLRSSTTDDQARWKVMRSLVRAVEDNAAEVSAKAWVLNACLALLIVETLLLVAGVAAAT